MDKCNRDTRSGQASCFTGMTSFYSSTSFYSFIGGRCLSIHRVYTSASRLSPCSLATTSGRGPFSPTSFGVRLLLHNSGGTVTPHLPSPSDQNHSEQVLRTWSPGTDQISVTTLLLLRAGFNNSLASPAPSLCRQLAELLGKPWHNRIQDKVAHEVPGHTGSS